MPEQRKPDKREGGRDKVYLSRSMNIVIAESLFIKIVSLIFTSNINSINKRKVLNSSQHMDNWISLGTAVPVAKM